jgi:hypothetical protein
MGRKAVERTNTSWRISVEAKRLLELMAEKLGVSQSAVFEQAIREKARREKVTVPDGRDSAAEAQRKEAARQRLVELLEKARAGFDDLTPEEIEREVSIAREEARESLRARGHSRISLISCLWCSVS